MSSYILNTTLQISLIQLQKYALATASVNEICSVASVV